MATKALGRILPDYTRRVDDRTAWRRRALVIVGLILAGIVYGAIIAVLPQAVFVPVIPIGVLLLLFLWLVPDVDRLSAETLRGQFLAFIVVFVGWPSYIAIDAPGLPWVNVTRLLMFSLTAIFLWSLATCARFRADVWAIPRAMPGMFWSFVVFWITTTITLPISDEMMNSVNKWLNNQMFWTGIFLLGGWVAFQPGRSTSIARLLVIMAIVLCAVAIPERIIGKPIWSDYIPGFLKVDPLILERVLSGQFRAADGIYRARATYNVSLSFAEYLAMALPFALHFFMETKGLARRLAMALALALIFVGIVITNARSGMVGLLGSLLLYAMFWGVRRWRKVPNDVWGPAMVLSYPAAAVAFVGLMLAWNRLYVMVIGGGQHAASTDARATQWASGLAKLQANPFGYGAARAGDEVGFFAPNGMLTIDSWYLTLLLDYGVMGFCAFVLMLSCCAWRGYQLFTGSDDPEIRLAGCAAIGLVNFLIIKAVLSQEANMSIAFILVGMVAALVARSRGVTITTGATTAGKT